MTDREWDRRLRIKTIGREDESDPNCTPYEPTPYAVLERVAESGYIRRRDRLLDYGCGKGRVAVFMAHAVGCAAVGIDHAQRLIDLARENRRACPAGDRVALFCARAEQHPLGDETAFFFFNPFSEKIFDSVLRRILASCRENPRRATLLCYYPSEAYLQRLDAAEELRPLEPIDCRDLFGGKNPREQVACYRFDNP